MRILVASDLQIGAGATLGRTLSDYDDLLDRIVQIATAQHADLFLGLGDAFQNRTTNRDQDEVFVRFLAAMSGVCPVLWVNGNHDWRGHERASTVGIFAEMGITISAEPGVYRYGDVAVATLPWASLGHMVAADNGAVRGELAAQASEHLVTIARGLREQISPGETAILGAHWACTGAKLPTGLPTEMLTEPIVEIANLEAQGWDVIALGHVHFGQSVGERGGAFVCGSPYACDWGESEFPHGVWILDEPDPATRGVGEDAVLTPSFIRVPDRSFSRLDLSDLEEPPYEIAEALVMDAFVRVDEMVLPAEQARRVDVRALRRALYNAGAHFVAPIVVRPERDERVRVATLTEEASELDAVSMWCEAVGVNGTHEQALRVRTERLMQAVDA